MVTCSIFPFWIRTWAIWITCCVWIIHGNHDAKRLYDYLLRQSHYNKLIRPVANTSDSIVVEMGIKLTQIIDVVRKKVSYSEIYLYSTTYTYKRFQFIGLSISLSLLSQFQ